MTESTFLDSVIVQNDPALWMPNSQKLFYGHNLSTFYLRHPSTCTVPAQPPCTCSTPPHFPSLSPVFWIHLSFYPNIVVNNFNNICPITNFWTPLLTYNLHIAILPHWDLTHLNSGLLEIIKES